jgi:hypothetical protein
MDPIHHGNTNATASPHTYPNLWLLAFCTPMFLLVAVVVLAEEGEVKTVKLEVEEVVG